MPTCNSFGHSANPALLLLEPETLEQSETSARLDGSAYRVSRAGNLRDLFRMHALVRFSVAILSDAVGSLALRASAHAVRREWPGAQILILGRAPHRFDDFLYDEAVVHTASNAVLIASLDRLTGRSTPHKTSFKVSGKPQRPLYDSCIWPVQGDGPAKMVSRDAAPILHSCPSRGSSPWGL